MISYEEHHKELREELGKAMRVDFWEVHKETEESSKEELDLSA